MDSDLPRCTEKTVVVNVPSACLPHGRRWTWLGDCNVLALADNLTEAERQDALVEVGAVWRRSFLRVVDSDEAEPNITDDLQVPTAS